MKRQKYLVTGGAGFIGSHIVQHLVENDQEVVVLDNCTTGCKIPESSLLKVHFIQGDIRDYATVEKAVRGCTRIIHLAALVGVEEVLQRQMDTIEIEIMGTQNLVKAAVEQNVQKIIYTSSSAVYKNTIGAESREDDTLVLANDYAVAKRMNELYLQSLTAEKGIQTVSVRLFNVYGTGQDERMVVPRFFQNAVKNEPIVVFGDGSQTRDFTSVEDVVTAIDLLLKHPSVTGVFNVANNTELTIKELAYFVRTMTASNSEIHLQPFPKKRLSYKVQKRVGNTDKLFSVIGFRPNSCPKEGLRRYFIKDYQPEIASPV